MSVSARLAKAGAMMYDVEIISAIPEKGKLRDPNLHYCGGWEDYEGMGISVVSVYDFVEACDMVFLSDNLMELKTLMNSRSILIGFNNNRFDDNLIRCNGFLVPHQKTYDMYKMLVDTQHPTSRKGFSLNDLLVANGLPSKTGLGSDAPMLAQTGQWGKLINYSIADVKKQVQILLLLCNGVLKNPHNGEYMSAKLPWDVVKVEGGIFT